MVNLLKYLLLEEIRLHSEMRGYRSFSLFPLVLLLGTGVVSYFLIRFSSLGDFSFGSVVIFFAFGIMCGTFGLHATDYLERRFGDYGKLFSNTMVLPIKLRHVFLMTALGDMIFYFGWFILPLLGGVTGALVFAGKSVAFMPLLLLSITCAFMIGMGVSFLLTVAINQSWSLFGIFFVLSASGLVYSFLPYSLYVEFSLLVLIGNLAAIGILFGLAALLVGNEFHTRRKGKHHSLHFRGNHLLFKDFIDLYRTHGLFAKPLFNVVIPSILMLMLLGSLNILEGELALVTHNLVFAAILLGTLSINFFNVLLAMGIIIGFIFLVSASVYIIKEYYGLTCSCHMTLPIFIFVLTSLGVFVGILTYYFLSKSFSQKKNKLFGNIEKTLNFLEKEEKEIVTVLIKEGDLAQNKLSKITKIDPVKLYRRLSSLEERKIIRKEKKGMTNIIHLENEFKEIFIK
ncbi:MAG: hypothetical protein ACLFP2_01795 [Candidatus Woesearchaeota archaeon]